MSTSTESNSSGRIPVIDDELVHENKVKSFTGGSSPVQRSVLPEHSDDEEIDLTAVVGLLADDSEEDDEYSEGGSLLTLRRCEVVDESESSLEESSDDYSEGGTLQPPSVFHEVIDNVMAALSLNDSSVDD